MLFSPTLFFPLLATRAFQLGASGYGLLLALFGSGALPGALLAARQAPTGARVRTLALLTGAAVVLCALAPDPSSSSSGSSRTGVSSIWMVAAANTLVQLRAAPELRGRVMGAWTDRVARHAPDHRTDRRCRRGPRSARASHTPASALSLPTVGLACWRGFGEPSG